MLTNKYSNLYYKIIATASKRVIPTYTETHHIVPQSLGGTNEISNLVKLSAREHFICHWLLIKMTEGEERSKMLYALNGMKAENRYQQRYHTKITARVYEKYRIEHATNHSNVMKGKPAWNKGKPMSDEQKKLLREIALRRPPKSDHSKEKWRKARLGFRESEETKLKKSLALKGKPKGPMSEEQKLKRSLKQRGVKKVKTHSANVAAAVLGNISINKDGIEKKIKRPALQTWLEQGWNLGARKRPKPLAQ